MKKLPAYDSKSIYPNKKALSSSQFLLFERDPSAFYLEYSLGSRRLSSKPMMIGSIFSAAYADRSFPFVEHLTELGCTLSFVNTFGEAIAKLPVIKNGSPEMPIWAKQGKWKFRATLDDWIEDLGVVIENKTGMKEWTQTRADENDQLSFQAWAVWNKYGQPPHKIILNWWDTRVKTHARILTFQTSRSIAECEAFSMRVAVVIENLKAGNFNSPIK